MTRPRLATLLALTLLAALPGCDGDAAWSAVVDGAYNAVSNITANVISSVAQTILGTPPSGPGDSSG
jgi:hypothetical protein